jgi:hypothetical protein
MKVGIIGSRRRNTLKDRKQVLKIVGNLISVKDSEPFELVSGGCLQGADAFAEAAARAYEIPIKVFPVDRSTPILHKGEFAERAFSRNRQIAEYSTVIVAWVTPDRTGGTENTIKHAHELKKPVYVVDESGRAYLEHAPQEGTGTEQAAAPPAPERAQED